jgi:hypothetical protein
MVLYKTFITLWLEKYGVDYIKSRVSGAAARNRTAADILHTSIELDKQLFAASVKHTVNLNLRCCCDISYHDMHELSTLYCTPRGNRSISSSPLLATVGTASTCYRKIKKDLDRDRGYSIYIVV